MEGHCEAINALYSDMYMICGNVQGTSVSDVSFWDLCITSGATSNPIGMTFWHAPLTVCLWRDFCRRIAAGRAGGRGDRTGREQED